MALNVVMVALVTVDAHARNVSAPSDPGKLSEYLLGRELAYYGQMHENGRITTSLEMMRRTVFLATLTGPLSDSDAIEIAVYTHLAESRDLARTLIDEHAKCYPPISNKSVVQSLQPSIFGEDFLACHLPGAADPLYVIPWSKSAAGRILAADDPDSSCLAPAITRLAEAGKRWSHVAEYLAAILRANPSLALRGGGPALMAIANTASLDLLEAIEPRLPDQQYDLDLAIAVITRRLVQHRLKRSSDPAVHASLNRNSVAGLGRQGIIPRLTLQPAKQLRSIEVWLRRTLVPTSLSLPDHCMSLVGDFMT